MKMKRQDKGYALITTLIIFGLSLFVIEGMLRSASNNAKLQAVVNTNNQRYYDVEDQLGKATAWFQDNSSYLTGLFRNSNFGTYFIPSDPSVGDNDDDSYNHFTIPTQIKVNVGGTCTIDSNNVSDCNTPILSNNPTFGTSDFPTGITYDGSSTRDLIADFESAFPNAESGGVNMRITLIAAITSGSGSDYSPIFRVDAITGNNPDRGTHLYSYVYGEYVTNTITSLAGNNSGVYGHNLVDMTGGSACRSVKFNYVTGAWVKDPIGANCLVQSQGNVDLNGAGIKIHGAAKTNTSSGVSDPAKVTDNNTNGCAAPGCHTALLNTSFPTYATSCPSGGADITYSANDTLSASAAANCWGTITIENGVTLTLDTPNSTAVYHFNSINFKSGNSRLAIAPPDAQNDVIEMHVNDVVGSTVNGRNLLNATFAPKQYKFVYLDTDTLTLNGTAEMRTHIFSPNATVNTMGTFNFYGKINALNMTSNGTGDIFSDEVNDYSPVSSTTANINFRITKVVQRYR